LPLESAAEKPAKPVFTPQTIWPRALMASSVLPANAGALASVLTAANATAASLIEGNAIKQISKKLIESSGHVQHTERNFACLFCPQQEFSVQGLTGHRGLHGTCMQNIHDLMEADHRSVQRKHRACLHWLIDRAFWPVMASLPGHGGVFMRCVATVSSTQSQTCCWRCKRACGDFAQFEGMPHEPE
jgi:hypothetical protein